LLPHYFNPVKIIKTSNWLLELENGLKSLGIKQPVIITTNGNNERLELEKKLNKNNIFTSFSNNPNFNDCSNAIKFCEKKTFDGVVAIGGGSAMDLAKVFIAYLSSLESNLKKLINDEINFITRIPSIFIPTTHGTASEVTMWGTIWDMEGKKKYSISNVNLYPDISILDGNLTLTLPMDLSIITTMDALSHSFESIWNKNSNGKSTSYAVDSICSIIRNVEKLKKTPSDLRIRNELLLASNKAGLAFSNTKTAAAHSISYPLTINYGIPHGIASSLSLEPLLNINAPLIGKEIDLICKNLDFSLKDLKEKIKNIPDQILPFKLNLWGVKRGHIKKLVKESFTKGRMDNNIVTLNYNDVYQILKSIY
tara:strand:+ start:126196 stop:127296 length:1101 start_codon:yes stop_codon:yes gene_type:complete